MARLREQQIRRISQSLAALYEEADAAALPWHYVRACEPLFPSLFCEVDIIRHGLIVDGCGTGHKLTAAETELFNAHRAEHPLLLPIVKELAHAPHAVGRWSEYTTLAAFRKTALHREIFRPVRCNYQLGLGLRVSPGEVVALSFHREHRDFTDSERAALEMMAPHLRLVHAQVAARVRRERLLALREQAGHASLVVEAATGAILLATEEARRLLALTPEGASLVELLPPALLAWVRRGAPAGAQPPLPLAHGSLQVKCTPVPGPGPNEPFSLVHPRAAEPGAWILDLQECCSAPPADFLRRLGLTRRESEVLHWMSEGKRNSEIAQVLHLETRTVEKHCENIMARLQVETRTAAVAEAWRSFCAGRRG